MENTETQNSKVATSIRLDTELYEAVAQLAAEEDRPSQANMIERLIKTHPAIVRLMSAEAAATN